MSTLPASVLVTNELQDYLIHKNNWHWIPRRVLDHVPEHPCGYGFHPALQWFCLENNTETYTITYYEEPLSDEEILFITNNPEMDLRAMAERGILAWNATQSSVPNANSEENLINEKVP